MVCEILEDGKSVGRARVEQQGLYYRIECRCKLEHLAMVRVHLLCNETDMDLGIMIPDKGELVLRTRIPVKRLGKGPFRFLLHTGREKDRHFVAIYPDEPFAYLQKLNTAYLKRQDDRLGVVVQMDSSKPTGQ